jgi:hypothetical protein
MVPVPDFAFPLAFGQYITPQALVKGVILLARLQDSAESWPMASSALKPDSAVNAGLTDVMTPCGARLVIMPSLEFWKNSGGDFQQFLFVLLALSCSSWSSCSCR